jgi:hypothetical protein
MYLIDLEKAKPGMTLAKSVHTIQDMLLLKADVRLTEKNIHVLKSWGIHELWVVEAVDNENAGKSELGNELRVSIDDALKAKFSDTLSDPLMGEIMRISGNILEKRLSNKDKLHGAQ